MEGLELICFEMISFNGSARSSYVEAITAAKNSDFARAEELMAEGNESFEQGHKAHAKLIQREAAGESTEIKLLLIHAEDLMMSAETLRIMAEEMIELYKRVP
ncbi:MAG: PTS lactose/cellobiose transporter subunit IIA [Firmicutes bacterium]|nr:PTS lactose/cellobiose transporter subunit IIA [Bacillota bacterium]